MQLKGKTALITGASRGIGKEIALALAKEGADIIVNYAGNSEMAEKVVEEIKSYGSKAVSLKANVADFNESKEMIEKIKQEFKKIDILVNNAGITRDRTLKKMTEEEWNSVINVNLTGAFNITKNALSIMPEESSIINISSIVGICGNFGQANYSASKAGIIGFTKTMAKELGKKKIRINVIAPGFIETDMTKSLPFIRKKIIQNFIPMKEFGSAEDVANAVVFFASEKSKYITGQTLQVDGGLNF